MQLPRVHASWQAGMCLVWGTFLYLAREPEKVVACRASSISGPLAFSGGFNIRP